MFEATHPLSITRAATSSIDSQWCKQCHLADDAYRWKLSAFHGRLSELTLHGVVGGKRSRRDRVMKEWYFDLRSMSTTSKYVRVSRLPLGC